MNAAFKSAARPQLSIASDGRRYSQMLLRVARHRHGHARQNQLRSAHGCGPDRRELAKRKPR